MNEDANGVVIPPRGRGRPRKIRPEEKLKAEELAPTPGPIPTWDEVAKASPEDVKLGDERMEMLPAALSPQQRMEKGDELAHILGETARLRAVKKETIKEYAARIALEEGKASELYSQLNQGIEQRQVPCRDEYIFRQRKVLTRRLDTGEVVGRPRAMRRDELQGELPGVPAKPPRRPTLEPEDIALSPREDLSVTIGRPGPVDVPPLTKDLEEFFEDDGDEDLDA